MASFTNNGSINMDGSSDAFFRYKMPAIVVKHEGKGKMKKSVLVNIKDVCESIGRPADYLTTYLGQRLSATAKVEKELALSYVTGHHNAAQLQETILNFIRDAVMCPKCQNPETSCHKEGSKKKQKLFLQCKGCGEHSELDSTDRFVKYMISHHAEDASYGHAANNTSATIATIRQECPKCHHKTSKATCSKCGGIVVSAELVGEGDAGKKIELLAESTFKEKRQGKAESKKIECPTCHHKTSKSVCSKCGTHIGETCSQVCQLAETPKAAHDLVGSLRLGMKALEVCNDKITLEDLLSHVKMESLTNMTPLDHLGAVVQIVAGDVCGLPTIRATKLQPVKVADQSKQTITAWSGIINELVVAVGDDVAVDIVISKVQEGVACGLPADMLAANGDCVVVGLLLALRVVDGVANGLLVGCRRVSVRSAAMNKFIDFLESEEADDRESEEEAMDGVDADA